jgi:diphthine synthase
MSVGEGLELLKKAEAHKKQGIIADTLQVVGVARIGSPNQKIVAGTLAQVEKMDFGKPPHCIIIPGKLHSIEEEMLALWRQH